LNNLILQIYGIISAIVAIFAHETLNINTDRDLF